MMKHHKSKKLLHRLFRHKKVVIISDNHITTLPVSAKIQAFISILFIVTMVWVSYSSGKYFAYQDIISIKDKEILHTNLTNENLQYQVTDLHRNFTRLDQYFARLHKIQNDVEKTAAESKEGKQSKEITENTTDEENNDTNDQVSQLEDEMRDIIIGLHGQINQRIFGLENVIRNSGIQLDTIYRKNKSLKEAAAKSTASASLLEEKTNIESASTPSQGGPFIPVNHKIAEMHPKLFEQSMEHNVNYLIRLEEIINHMPFALPMKNARITSGFGHRIDPFNKRKAMHYGIDFVGKYKDPIYAPLSGKVTKAGRYGAYGKFVEIDHGHGFTTRYGHLSSLKVKKSQKIKKGDIIGTQGNTGRSTGQHLHYEIRLYNKPLNPYKLIQAGKYVL